MSPTASVIRFLRSRLFVRVALSFLVVSLIPVLGSGALSFVLAKSTAYRDAEQRQQEVAELSASLVTVWLDAAQQRLRTAADLLGRQLAAPNVGTYSAGNDFYIATVDNRLNFLVEEPTEFLEVEYYANAPEPQQVSNVQSAPWQGRGVDRSGTRVASELVQQPLEAGVRWRQRDLEVVDGTPTLSMSEPIHASPVTEGVLVADLDFTPLRDLLATVAADVYELRVVDGAGTPVVEHGLPPEDPMGVRVSVGESDWTVSVREPRARVTASLERLVRQIGLWTAVAAALAVAVSLGLSARVTRPVDRLRRTAEAMAGGDLAARARLDRADEIGRLGAAFDRMAEALHQLDEAKSEFIGNVSHELRTPLTSMHMSIANLLDGVVGELDARQREVLTRVSRELDRLAEMVNQLLEIARIDAGVVELRRTEVDLAALAREVAGAQAAPARDKGVELVVEGAGVALADPAHLRRALDNLVDNAVKYGPPGSPVRIRVADGLVEVEDQGPGLDDEQAFEKFRRGPGVQKVAGAGLGLAIVKKIVELHDGAVSARSEGGTVVRVDLREERA